MASKNKKGAGVTSSAGLSPCQEVERLIAKKWYKDAVKQAKICHRDHPSPEHHRLLERAYFLRAQELRDGGMPTAAAEVAGHLLDIGITDAALTEPAAALMMAVGLSGKAIELQRRIDAPEAVERLNRQAADQAVLHPERAAGIPADLREGAKKVRTALEAVIAGGNPAALDILRDVSRQSPFADWRLFARGLAASRRGDDAEARANWDRLDPSRAPARIAQTLVEATDPALRNALPSAKLEAIERWAFGEPILAPLRDLGDAVAQGLWEDAVRKMTPVRLALRRVDPAQAVRLTRALYSLLIQEATRLPQREGQNLLKGFTRAAEPMPFDPRWNRLWAIAWDGSQGHPEQAESFWRKYADDLDGSPALQPDERLTARALILTHIGEEWSHFARDLGPDPNGPDFGRASEFDEEIIEARNRAVTVLEESLRLFPSHRPTYQALIENHDNGNQPDHAADVSRRMLDAFPDDFEALQRLTLHHLGRNEPAQALPFAIRARALRPLDPKVVHGEWNCRLALARHLAIAGQGNEGRAELEIVARGAPEIARAVGFAARRAGLEFKVGRAEAAEAILQEARGARPDPAPLWLAMGIEARRYQLPQPVIDRFESLWKTAATGKARGDTAGALAKVLGSFFVDQIDYPGRDEHAKQVVTYLGRTTRLKYPDEENLTYVCAFLDQVSCPPGLCEKLTRRGLKLFPESPTFPLILGTMEMTKGPFHADVNKARRHFESALTLALAREGSDPKYTEIIPSIRQQLSLLTDLTSGPMGMGRNRGMPFPFPMPGARAGSAGGKGPIPADLAAALGDVLNEMAAAGINPEDLFGPDFIDEDDDDADAADVWSSAPTPAPAPRPRGKNKKKKGKRK